MLKKFGVLLVLLMVIIFSSGCGNKTMAEPKAGEFVNIDVETTKQIINNEKDVLLLDVRTPEEFNSGHIPNAVNIPGQYLESQLTKIDKNRTIIVVCLSGARSELAARFLAQNGYTKVYNFADGMQIWDGDLEQ